MPSSEFPVCGCTYDSLASNETARYIYNQTNVVGCRFIETINICSHKTLVGDRSGYILHKHEACVE